MANLFIPSANMNLPIPIVGVDTGPDYANNLNACLTMLDAHNHSSGSGVQITTGGININSDLQFNGNSSIGLLKLVLNSQSGVISGTNFISNINGNLYFNDGSSNQVQITSGGGVAGSPGSIGSLTAPAAATYSFGSKLFIWTAASGKAAAMDNGAVTIRETNVASAKGITLASPSALAADIQFTLPGALPASTQYLTSTNLGVTSFSTADQIGSAMTLTGADAIGASMSSVGANDVGVSMTSTGANAVLASVSSVGATQANLVGVAMTATGANAVASSLTSTSAADNVLKHSSLGVVTTTTSVTTSNIIGGYNAYASITIAVTGRYLVYCSGSVAFSASGSGEVDYHIDGPGGTETPSLRSACWAVPSASNGFVFPFTLVYSQTYTVGDSVVFKASSALAAGTASFDSSFKLQAFRIYPS